jgi:hypothetical protein
MSPQTTCIPSHTMPASAAINPDNHGSRRPTSRHLLA